MVVGEHLIQKQSPSNIASCQPNRQTIGVNQTFSLPSSEHSIGSTGFTPQHQLQAQVLASTQNNSSFTKSFSNTITGGNNKCNLFGNINAVENSNASLVIAKNQLEHLSTMREALFSQDGWGCQHVNQDTNWEVPSSPEPTNKDSAGGPTVWKPNINNGTDLWESNLRNGGQPTNQPIQKTPWGHTPSSNLGGTWGEDDDISECNSVWTSGAASNAITPGNLSGVNVAANNVGNIVNVASSANGGSGQWPQTGINSDGSSVAQSSNTGNIGAVPSSTLPASSGAGNINIANVSVGSSNNSSINNWTDIREIRNGQNVAIEMRNIDHRGSSNSDIRDLRLNDQRDPIRGDPRGISGRLNGSSEMWGQHHSISHSQIPMNKLVGPNSNLTPNIGVTPPVSGINAGINPNINSANNNVHTSSAAPWGSVQVVGPKDIGNMNKQSTGWEEPSPPPQRRAMSNYDDGTALWGQQTRIPGVATHWKEIDPLNRNHLLRGTLNNPSPSLGAISGNASIGSSAHGQSIGAVPVGAGMNSSSNPINNAGGIQNRLSSVGPVGVTQIKQDQSQMWIHQTSASNNRNTGTWGDEGTHGLATGGNSSWVDEKANVISIGQLGANPIGANAWNETPTSAWNKSTIKVAPGTGGWNVDSHELSPDWVHSSIPMSKPQQKLGIIAPNNINLEIIKNSKQYRILVEAGFKKEDVERALVACNMNIEEATDMLRINPGISVEGWRRHEDNLAAYNDHPNANPIAAGNSFQSRYTSVSSQPNMVFATNNSLQNTIGNPTVSNSGSGIVTLNSLQPSHVQKYLNQGPHNLTGLQAANTSGSNAFNQGTNVNNAATAATVNTGGSNASGQPSAQHLRMLVQQIQLAVHSGYLSSQILNQPLAPTTLLLLNQLLSNIKNLQGAQQALSRCSNGPNMQINVAIARYKQQIQSLQSQISAQQNIYMKQQQSIHQQNQQAQQLPISSHLGNSNVEYIRGQQDALNVLQVNFSDINLNKANNFQGVQGQQSRLNQWKLPVIEKDSVTSDIADFSRAPGTNKQNLSASSSHTIAGPLGIQNDGTWSNGRNVNDGWPESSNDNENKDWTSSSNAPSAAYTDLVQEFEPGKPWKGSQMKSIEDDPSITPGSVVRSPLSVNSTQKESDIFANTCKTSPTDLPPLSLSSSTWSFNPPSSNPPHFSSWTDTSQQQNNAAELWSSPMNKTIRGPPPGLSTNKSNSASLPTAPASSGNSSSWSINGRHSNTSWATTNSNWNSNWLLLKNLTAQIDSSTLRTLCMQHGPLLSFHLYLNQGIALCKYATREEASKAQTTLNNCVLGNTSICAESPSEHEVQSILHLPQNANLHHTVISTSGNTGSANVNQGSIGSISGNNSSNDLGNPSSGNSMIVVDTPTNNNAIHASGTGVALNSASQELQSQAITTVNSNMNNTNSLVSCNSPGVSTSNSVTNAGTVSANNTVNAWRQAQQNQLQNQARQTGRETDFDYISKFVCSIVDD